MAGNSDDQTLQLLDRVAANEQLVFANVDNYDSDYDTIEFVINRRFKDRWMLMSSFGYSWLKQFFGVASSTSATSSGGNDKVHDWRPIGEHAASLRTSDGRALNLVDAARGSLGDRDGARRAFEASLTRDPRHPASYVNLAQLELETSNAGRAAALFSEALVLDPASIAARQGLDSARALLR